MTGENFAVSEKLLTQYCLLKETHKDKLKSVGNSLLTDNIFTNKTMNIENSNQFLSEFSKISKDRKQKNKNESCDFNVFSFFKVDEPKHSSLLAFLLNPHESHGQGNLFLKNFLLRLNILNPDSNNWTVTAEKGRIDILLTRVNPHSIIIIENKSNRAVDQQFQLYRYWYHQIHKRKYQIDYATDEYKQKYQIIYLTPHSSKIPTDNSLSKPDISYDLPDHLNLPDRIPIEPKIWEFSKEISELLESSTNQLQSENHRLKEYIFQYLELIKNLN
jgi:hypothetical protein